MGMASASILRTRSGATVLIAQLPPLQPGRVYQLWRIQGNNNPTSAGIFRVSSQGYGTTRFRPSQQPQAGEVVAVTRRAGWRQPRPNQQAADCGNLERLIDVTRVTR